MSETFFYCEDCAIGCELPEEECEGNGFYEVVTESTEEIKCPCCESVVSNAANLAMDKVLKERSGT